MVSASRDVAKEYRDYHISTIPIGPDKIPTIGEWGQLQKRLWGKREQPYFEKAKGIGIVAGDISNGMECIDFDNKEGNAKASFKKFRSDENIRFLFDRYQFIIQQTPSGGYHLINTYQPEGILFSL